MQARGLPNFRLKFCCLKVICCHGRNEVGDRGDPSPHCFREWGYNMSCPSYFLFRFRNLLVSHQPVLPTFYNKIAPISAVYVNQTNLNVKLSKKLEGGKQGPAKNLGGRGPPRTHLRTATGIAMNI